MGFVDVVVWFGAAKVQWGEVDEGRGLFFGWRSGFGFGAFGGGDIGGWECGGCGGEDSEESEEEVCEHGEGEDMCVAIEAAEDGGVEACGVYEAQADVEAVEVELDFDAGDEGEVAQSARVEVVGATFGDEFEEGKVFAILLDGAFHLGVEAEEEAAFSWVD